MMQLTRILKYSVIIGLALVAGSAFADGGGGGDTVGKVASTITSSFTSVAKLITGGSYVAGLGFAIGAILKFKQHKDNPSQITIGTPIALVLIAAALLFLPSILEVSGSTMFSDHGKVAGPEGVPIIGKPAT